MDTTMTAKIAMIEQRVVDTGRARRFVARAIDRTLRVPLAAKLLGANIGVTGVALLVAVLMQRGGADSGAITLALSTALVVGAGVNVALTWVALRPIREIERTIWRVRHGDPDVRVSPSPVADANIKGVGRTLNALLDNLERDRQKMRELATEVIRAEARERARVGENLRESIAQSVAAVSYQLTALVRECSDPTVAARIGEIRMLANQTLDEIDVLSHSVHPRVLNDLGLVAGLRMLAREVSTPRTKVTVCVTSGREDDLRGLGLDTSAALFRVAQEAVQNALRHSGANGISICVGVSNATLTLTVDDNGTGFDVTAARERRPGMGLFTMRQRMSLIGGALEVESDRARGTHVVATMPVEPAVPARV
ncbi:MAG TPA: ATP-binding protein [Gemmatimonadaceae bacterium]|nr:ATP-binding protein [Gemmatimonadaceae bacterium]